MIVLRRVSYAEFFAEPKIEALIAEYAAECANPELPGPNPHKALYKALYDGGVLYPVIAYDDDEPTGFAVLLVSIIPHYGIVLAHCESLFVTSGARDTAAGAKLLAEAKTIAREKGANGLMITAPLNSRLDEVLDKSKEFRPSNRVYFKPLN